MKLFYSVLLAVVVVSCQVSQPVVQTTAKKPTVPYKHILYTVDEFLQRAGDSTKLKEMFRIAYIPEGGGHRAHVTRLLGPNAFDDIPKLIDTLKTVDSLLLKSMLIYSGFKYREYYGDGEQISENCECRGIPLYGRVRVVQRNATFRVKVTNDQADLNVQRYNMPTTICGLWYFIESENEDFTIEYVNSGEDFSIAFTPNRPGLGR